MKIRSLCAKYDNRKWEQQFLRDYRAWISSGFIKSNESSRNWLLQFYNHHFLEGNIPFRPQPYQKEAILRTIYMLEFFSSEAPDGKNIPLNFLGVEMATGTGKTLVMANIMSWASSTVLNGEPFCEMFILLCPNTIVRERLWDDFKSNENGTIFHRIGFPNTRINSVNVADSAKFP